MIRTTFENIGIRFLTLENWTVNNGGGGLRRILFASSITPSRCISFYLHSFVEGVQTCPENPLVFQSHKVLQSM